ncbi:MAG: hypothetical protein U0414_39755 [Polyangiaceae bacterium]
MSRSNLARWMFLFALSSPAAVVATEAFAGAEACGKFDFSSGISCKIEVKGGCSAKCTPLNFEAGCKGTCTGMATTTCTGSCGTQCLAECNPNLLDCFAGCHAECDQPATDLCNMKNPGDDCVSIATAQCDMHCEDACKVPDTSCSEHCKACCDGGCTTQSNYQCDYDCFAKLEGGCEVQCTEPSGALFCNGQYIGASDVQGCVDYLLTQGIKVDVTARGEVTCDLTGCKGSGDANAGFCSYATGSADLALGGVGIAAVGLAAGLAFRRRRRAKVA